MKTEKHYYKLTDYFVTIGIDNYQTQDEMYKQGEVARDSVPNSEGTVASTPDTEMAMQQNATIDQSRQQQR